ncbi:MAG: glycosyltransferase family 4 protein [Bacteroidaceae bacterium]|nr:glycosyltransferase family 4 protein [Bacteroidaceae bacterium]
MNVIFLTLVRISNIDERHIYADLMRKFRDEGHQVYIVTAAERRLGQNTSLADSHGVKILNVKTLDVQKTNIVEKGIGTLLIERQFKSAIKKYLGDVKFDLITYSTPPITFTNVVKYLKRENPQAISYLQLKDIFPQNAVDIGMMKTAGVKGLLYKFFRNKEKALYKVSDYIGCMSPANVQFLLKHNPEIDASRVEVAPNSVELRDVRLEDGQEKTERYYIRRKYELPTDKPVFIYGGNLGKPQGIDYLVKCLDANKKRTECYFVVVGTGTEYPRLEAWYSVNLNHNVKLMQGLPKADYDLLVRSCDVGMIFLDHRFTIPNYPSRLLSYLENKMPVLCATDVNTDIGKIAEENGYGYWCESVSPETFTALVDKMLASDRKAMGEKGYEFLKNNYLVEHTYNAIMKHF